jgi:hypothetical protein
MVGTRALALPSAFTVALAALAFVPSIRENSATQLACLGAAGALAVWHLLLAAAVLRRGRPLTAVVEARKQHYVQACAQATIFLYWGWYWPEVYQSAPLILAQLLFAYAFDMLLAWSRRDSYTLGFGPFPVIFSINLFLWFKPDWFHLQFAMVAIGFAAKELIRWTRDGRRVHVFNPSSFALAVFSLGLIVTGASDLTWGREIATTQFYPPQMYLLLFLVALPGQFLFGVASMTLSAVLSAWLFGLIYFWATGIYFFYDSYIPIAVFLGMHLLFTDPSTAPRTDLGRIVFGALYGLSTVALYQLLGMYGMPTFYDKLLQVPLLNLSIIGIDRMARSGMLQRLNPARMATWLSPRRPQLAYMFVWAVVFGGMSATGGVGDSHPGQWLPFWQQACESGRPYACPYVADRQLAFCRQGSGWACNEAGILHLMLAESGEDLRRLDPAGAAEPLDRGCNLGFGAACRNLAALRGAGGRITRTPPTVDDYGIVLRGSKGAIREQDSSKLMALACRQGWPGTCGTGALARGAGDSE